MPEERGSVLKKYAESGLCRLLLDMLRIPSVSPSPEHENRVTRLLYDTLAVLPYFREHPEDLRLLPLEDDPFGRNFLFAFVRRPGPTAETVILAGHADVVSAEACGELAPFAFDPEEYTRRLEDVALPEDARRDLESGEWLFGRGVADMKSGLAAGIELLAEAASDPGSLGANLLALAVPDEENNSAGMLAASAQLARRQKEEGLRYRACIELEPTFAGGEWALPSIYLGSIGKINTFFFCAGKETHVGEYYEGFGAAPPVEHRSHARRQPGVCGLAFRQVLSTLRLHAPDGPPQGVFSDHNDPRFRVLQLSHGNQTARTDTFGDAVHSRRGP